MKYFKIDMKNLLAKNYSKFNYPLIVNSYGRSGSTLLANSIVESAIACKNTPFNYIIRKSISQSLWDLNKTTYISNGVVYKTHDYPPNGDFNRDARVLYIYANPVDVVLSLKRIYTLRGDAWMKMHFEHLGRTYSNFEQIYEKDILGLSEHFDAWLNVKNIPVAFIKYEGLWNNTYHISRYLGFDVMLPEQRQRKSLKIEDKELRLKLATSYNGLLNIIDSLEDFFVINNEND